MPIPPICRSLRLHPDLRLGPAADGVSESVSCLETPSPLPPLHPILPSSFPPDTSSTSYNVWIGMNTDFPSTESQEEQFCQQTVFILYRQAGAALLLYPVLLILNGRIHWPESWRDAMWILLQGISGIYVNQFLFLLGLARTTPNLAAIFQVCLAHTKPPTISLVPLFLPSPPNVHLTLNRAPRSLARSCPQSFT